MFSTTCHQQRIQMESCVRPLYDHLRRLLHFFVSLLCSIWHPLWNVPHLYLHGRWDFVLLWHHLQLLLGVHIWRWLLPCSQLEEDRLEVHYRLFSLRFVGCHSLVGLYVQRWSEVVHALQTLESSAPILAFECQIFQVDRKSLFQLQTEESCWETLDSWGR